MVYLSVAGCTYAHETSLLRYRHFGGRQSLPHKSSLCMCLVFLFRREGIDLSNTIL